MQKLTNLYRLDFPNRFRVMAYLLKRIVKAKVTEKEKIINNYYFHLMSANGVLKAEATGSFLSHYSDLDLTIKTRKRPSSDLDVFAQVFGYKEYKPVVETYIEKFKNTKGLKVIDAGSNIGLTAVYLSRFFADSAFICVEPDANNFDMMTFNVETNKVNATRILGGIWSSDTNLKIVKDFRDQNDWSFRVEETNEASGLQAFSIGSILKKHGWQSIDILKIDIEGSEKEIFLNPTADVSFLSITKCIAIEIHDEFDCREQIYQVLTAYGFDFFNSGELTIGVNKNLL